MKDLDSAYKSLETAIVGSPAFVAALVAEVTKDVAEAIKKVRSGQIEYKTDKTGIVHASVGKISFSLEELSKNIVFFYNELSKNKPTNSKGVFIKKIFISSTMGPGLQVDLSSVM